MIMKISKLPSQLSTRRHLYLYRCKQVHLHRQKAILLNSSTSTQHKYINSFISIVDLVIQDIFLNQPELATVEMGAFVALPDFDTFALPFNCPN